jgi:preprotein translocase subunit SecA
MTTPSTAPRARSTRPSSRPSATAHAKGQPVLVGTTSIEKSEMLGRMLKKAGLPHNVLNARQHEQEAQIVAEAGKLGASPSPPTWPVAAPTSSWAAMSNARSCRPSAATTPTATMPPSARGSKPTTRPPAKGQGCRRAVCSGHRAPRSRRIDNQLRGRSGRQGDPGRSSFFLSLEDDLMRIFGSDGSTRCCRRWA